MGVVQAFVLVGLKGLPDGRALRVWRLHYDGRVPSIEQLERLLKVDENDAFVHYALAIEHAKGGEGGLALALEHFDRCLAIDPNYLYAYYHKARVLIEAGRGGGGEVLRAGLVKAREARDSKAMGEMEGLLDSIS